MVRCLVTPLFPTCPLSHKSPNMSTLEMSSPLQSFHLFNFLPTELRFAIYRLSCQPRVVEVRYDAELDRCHSTAKPPALLHVNREAREEAMTWYEQAFRTRRRDEYIFFCATLDVLYLPRHSPMGYDDTAREFGTYILDTTEYIQELAVDHVRGDVIRPWEPYNKLCLLQGFPNLKRAYMVIEPGEERGRNDKAGSIELTEPEADPFSVTQIMDGVAESFYRELEIGLCDVEKEDTAGLMSPVPLLVPKSKSLRSFGGYSQMVACA